MQIKASEIKQGMIINDGSTIYVVGEVWADQGPGLGIMTKGKRIDNAKPYEKRYVNPDEEVGRVVREPDDWEKAKDNG